MKTSKTVDAISRIFCEKTKEVLDSITGKNITFAKTIQKVPVIHLRPDVGCFVLFDGDYAGLLIMNFSSDAAMEIYRSQMLKMGIPEEELAIEYTADEIVDSIGEIINQIIGSVRREIESQYELAATNTQPKAIALTSSIVLNIAAPEMEKDLCRKLSFKIDGHSFHIELSMEKTEFIKMDGIETQPIEDFRGDDGNIDIEGLKKSLEAEEASKSQSNGDLDFDALLKANT